MRPLKLTMQAFGPYADKECIDFTKLENRTMFVISGKTGAGKTTIFDGISYAIYGRASGNDRNGSELRSQFAQDHMLTEVALEFWLRNNTYYIWRSPQQEKKKERGNGYTTISAKAELYVLNDQGEKQLLAANVRDVDEKIKEIMQMDSNQFRQILMIPQGEFRKLLISDSKEKEVILQRLFHTEIYKRIEEKLKEEANQLTKSIEKLREERNHTVRAIQVIQSEELKSCLEAENTNDNLIISLLTEEIAYMNDELERLSEIAREQKEERDRLTQKLFEGEAIVKQLTVRDELKLKKAKLEEEKDIYEQKEAEITLAHKASILAQQEMLCHRLKRELDQANLQLTAISDNTKQLSQSLKAQQEALEQELARENERKSLADEINRLNGMENDVYSFARYQEAVTKLKDTIEGEKNRKDRFNKRMNALDIHIKQLQADKEKIEKGQLRFVENERTLDKLTYELAMLDKYNTLFIELHDENASFMRKKKEFENITARYEDEKALLYEIETRWHRGQAAMLAKTLHVGEPCPVCGSTHHPQPATSSDQLLPTEDDLRAAKQQMLQLERDKLNVEREYYRIQLEINSLEKSATELAAELRTIHPNFSAETLRQLKAELLQKQTELQVEQNDLKLEKKQLANMTATIVKLENEQAELKNKMESIETSLNKLTIEFTEKNTTLTRMMATIPENLRTIQAYEAERNAAQKKLKMMEKQLEDMQQKYQRTKEKFASEQARFETVQKQGTELATKLETERELFKETMLSQGFSNYTTYRTAKRTEQEIKILEQAVRRYREELRSVSDRYLELAELLKDVKVPQIDKLKEIIASIDEQYTKLQDDYTSLLMKKKDNEEIRQRIENINSELKELEASYQIIGHLSEMSKGQNVLRITFERFVLASFLDDILQKANVRLTKMTGGRYQLLRKTDRSKGNVQSGLELLVFDQYTGQERHVKTLSGGESFKAALSLALGLADVVQRHAGGVSLETMFIDEGFGTLDPESLDQAVEALIDIQNSGRLVGIISHVPELKERIDARLEVVATKTGSTATFEFLNG